MTRQDNNSNIYTVLAFCFADRSAAGEVLKELKAAKKLEDYHIVAEAVVEVDDKGKSHVHQQGRGGVGAAVGALSGNFIKQMRDKVTEGTSALFLLTSGTRWPTP